MSTNFLSTGVLSVTCKQGKEDRFLVMVSDPDLKGLVFMVERINNPLYEDPRAYLTAQGNKALYKLGWIEATGKPVMRRLLPDGSVDTAGTLASDDKAINKLLGEIEKQVKRNPMVLESILSISDMACVAGNALLSLGVSLEDVKQFSETLLNGKIAVVQNSIKEDWKIDAKYTLMGAVKTANDNTVATETIDTVATVATEVK